MIGHKGGRSYRVRFTGREAHSSLAPQAVNAISFAAELVVFLTGVAEKLKGGPSDPLYDIVYSTLSTGTISGGTAVNIVPRYCELVFEYRFLEGVDPDAILAEIVEFAETRLLPRMRHIASEAAIAFEENYAYPNFEVESDHPWVTRVKSWAKSNYEAKVAYGTEAGYFGGTLGIPTIVCGPGSIKQAHKPDEYVSADQLAACTDFLNRIGEFCRQ